jgi:hypothetical protein
MNKFCVRISENKSVHERNAIASTLTIESYALVGQNERDVEEKERLLMHGWVVHL